MTGQPLLDYLSGIDAGVGKAAADHVNTRRVARA